MFDSDYPGHYARQIKTISLSIPAILGPYEQLKATLTQLSNTVLVRPNQQALNVANVPAGMDHVEMDPGAADVRTNWRSNEQIAISSGVSDSGIFQLNFGDDRYLPFEGTGAVSRWRLEIPKRNNTLDYESISDVVLQLKYTSRFDGGLKDYVDQHLRLQRGHALIGIRPEFSSGWHQFLNPPAGATHHELRLHIAENLLPSNLTDFVVDEIFLKVNFLPDTLQLGGDLVLALQPGNADALDFTFNQERVDRHAPVNGGALGDWLIRVDRTAIPDGLRKPGLNNVNQPEVEDIQGVDHYLLDSKKIKNLELVLAYVGSMAPP